MSQTKRVPDLMHGDPFDELRIVRCTAPGRRVFRTHQDIGTAAHGADGIPGKDSPTGVRHKMNHDVRFLFIQGCIGDIGEGNQPIEAPEQDIVPCVYRAVQRCELFVGGARVA